jgi:small-conductance mechanosensitive channel
LFYSFKVVLLLLLLLLLLSLEWIDRTQQYSKFEALSTSCDFYDCLCYKAEYSMCFFLCFWWRVVLDKTLKAWIFNYYFYYFFIFLLGFFLHNQIGCFLSRF